MMDVRGLRRLAAALALALGMTLGAASASAQSPGTSADPWEDARALYRAQRFEQALPFIVEAIQREPGRAELYLGIARTHFQLGRLDEAVWYYDLYLRQFSVPPDGETAASRQIRERVLAERTSAHDARGDEAGTPALPAAQDSARQRFLERLEEGPVFASRGGGAIALWNTLLRTGYARPDLVSLRERLVAATRAEARALLPDTLTAIPALSLAEWELQQTRHMLLIEHAAEESDDPEVARDRAAAHFVDGQILLLGQNHAAARERFEACLALSPGFIPAHIARLITLIEGSDPEPATIREALTEAEAALVARELDPTAHVLLLQAAAARLLEQVPDTAVEIDQLLRRAQAERMERSTVRPASDD
ncbi:MAG: tetratricopeptide repeat protein [Deltaproteobacteria bacterium]|nr:MAG: tetratricopeptide repeat protein [Deltaproteobacteria bacterium]